MKKIPLFLIVFVLTSSFGGVPENPYTEYVPILMSREQLESSVVAEAPHPQPAMGKICLYGDLLLVNEPFKGVHLYDNTNPEAPQALAFIRIPGCQDIHVSRGFLYADNAVDLIVADLNNPADIRVTSRTRNIFRESPPPDWGRLPASYLPENRPANMVLVAWKRKQ